MYSRIYQNDTQEFYKNNLIKLYPYVSINYAFASIMFLMNFSNKNDR